LYFGKAKLISVICRTKKNSGKPNGNNQNVMAAAVQTGTALKQTKEIHYVQNVIRPQRSFYFEFQFLSISFILFLFVLLKTRLFCSPLLLL
jgi:hypothetical protein